MAAAFVQNPYVTYPILVMLSIYSSIYKLKLQKFLEKQFLEFISIYLDCWLLGYRVCLANL